MGNFLTLSADMAKQCAKIDPTMRLIRERRGMAARIAEACGIARGSVAEWQRVPAGRVLIVAKLLKISPKKIRPDIFGRK